MNKKSIEDAFKRLNDINGGYRMFELFCQQLIGQHIDKNFLPSTGSDAGGDGGIDGWSFLGENGKIKYAFSIDEKSKSKIKSEIKKTDLSKYKEIRFFTNQPIRQKTKEGIDRENPEVAITIYDIENLVDYVDRYPNLGQYIDLPLVLANITIDYLNDRNQFLETKEKISQYIPRTITYIDPEQKMSLETKSFLNYCSNLPKFTILQAPAGYGKTCVLEQLHQKILKKETEVMLPPVFIRLSTYVPSTLLSMIQEGMREGGDFRCNDFLLLLDGYDEVKECDREFLQKEIEDLLFSNESYLRKAIISAREHTYNESDFNKFQDKKIISLSKLTNEDIKLLFLKESIPAECEEVFFNNTFFQEFSDNIFYVVNFIEHFKAKKSIAGNVIQLFDFILSREIERLFRNDTPDEKMLESLVLYMTLHQNYFIAEQTVAKSFSLNLPMIPFRFSHNSIQEYLAAKKIAKQPIDIIKKIFTKGNLIIPYLTNTLGFVLNMLTLNEDRQADFKSLIDYFLSTSGNAKRLLQIEADKISPLMNHVIFKTVIEQESMINNWDVPKALVSFGLYERSKKENLQYLIDSIISFKDTNKFHYHTSILQHITIHYRESIDDEFQNQLIQFFTELLCSENIKNNTRFIESLLYSIAYFPAVKNLSIQEIQKLVEQLLSIDSESIVNNLCELLLTAEIKIDEKMYFKFFDFIIDRVEVEDRHGTYTVGSQITDDTYHEPMRYTHFYSFIPLTKKMLEENLHLVWNIIDSVFKKSADIRNDNFSSNQLEDLINLLYDFVASELENFEVDKNNENILIDLIADELNNYPHKSKLWEIIISFSAKIDLLNITKQIIFKLEPFVYSYPLLDAFVDTIITTENAFDKFKQEYFLEDNDRLQKFFYDFCRKIEEDHSLYNYVFSNIPEEMSESIITSKIESKKYVDDYEKEKQMQQEGYHITFHRLELIDEINKVLDIVEKEEMTEDTYWEYFHENTCGERNHFALFVFRKIYWDKKKSIRKEKLLECLEEDTWNMIFMNFLIRYMNQMNIHFDDFLLEEKDKCIVWAKTVIEKYPLNSIESKFVYIHITLSIVLRCATFVSDDSSFMQNHSNQIIGLVFSAFPNTTDDSYAIDYDSCSLNYLDSYIAVDNIINFICDNFSLAYKNDEKMISLCGYLKNHIEFLLPYQKVYLKIEITKYIEKNLNKSYHYDIVEFASTIGFSITDLDIEKLSKAIILNERKENLAHNYACCFIHYNYHKKSDAEIQHLSNALHLAFENCADDFLKKTIAEYYIAYNSFAGDVFVFYTNYLMEDDKHSMLEPLARRGQNTFLITADINHLDVIEKLFCYSQAKKEKSERRDSVLSIALSSYKAMADVAKSPDEIKKIVSSMESLAAIGNEFVHRHIQEIKNAFAERTYQPLLAAEIMELEN